MTPLQPLHPLHPLQQMAVIFDFDYTLADSARGIVECVERALSELRFPRPSPEQVKATIGLSLAETFKRITGVDDPDLAARFTRLFHQRADQVMDSLTSIYDSVRPTVARLRDSGIRTGIVSTKLNYRIRGILVANDLFHAFDSIVGADDVENAKPDPEGILLALRHLGTDPSAALYVGDHVVDAEAALAAGVRFVAVLTGNHSRASFERYPRVGILGSLRELPALLGLRA